MDEYIELLDVHGAPSGERCLKSVAHKKGYLHATVHVWFYTKRSDILIQKRKTSKDTFPGLWDVSVAGHIPFGESPEEGAIREVSEEIGLKIHKDDLFFFGKFTEKHRHGPNITDFEQHHVFFCELKAPIEQLVPQPEEVEEIKLLPLDTFISSMKHKPEQFVPHQKDYYTTILKELKKRCTA